MKAKITVTLQMSFYYFFPYNMFFMKTMLQGCFFFCKGVHNDCTAMHLYCILKMWAMELHIVVLQNDA